MLGRPSARRAGRVAAAVAALLAAVPAPAQDIAGARKRAAVQPGGLDTRRIAAERFGNDAPWYEGRIPFFESADPRIDAVYYYRWMLYRAHQRDLGERGFISTEFLDDVSWQLEPWASLNDASGFHIAEGRWSRDRRYADDYITFMYTGGNDRHFSDHMADSVWGRLLVDGDRAAAVRHLGAMRRLYDAWSDHFDADKGLYWVQPLLDATEYTISSTDASGGIDGFFGGDAFRPSINSYMYTNARAIARLIRLSDGSLDEAKPYDRRAAALSRRLHAALWSDSLGHFIDRYKVTTPHVRYWDPIRGRELVGYLPWMFDMAADDPKQAAAWDHLLDPHRLGGRYGMRTVEPSYPYYMHQCRYDGGGHAGGLAECQWNGPVWPFQTTQVLLGLANMLDHYEHKAATRSDHMRLLRQYSVLHYQGDRLNLEENYHPDTGAPIVGLGRSHHYFHSGYVDLILTGLAGIRPRPDDVIEVNPLLPAAEDPQALRWFRIQDVPYHGHSVAITWDADGSRYGRAGLAIEVDGREVHRQPTLGRVTLPLARRAVPAIDRPIARSIQLRRDGFPKASASSGQDPEALHDAIDGRVWFMPERGNGWSSDPSKDRQWLAIDFGKDVRLDRAELAFFSDGARFAAPAAYSIERWDGAG